MQKIVSIIIFNLILLVQSLANISLPAIFSDHMVLKANDEVKIWGWGKTGENVILTCSWDPAEIYETKVNTLGKWELVIKTNDSTIPQTINIKGYNEILISDVLLGEVWLCSGQSNMEWTALSGIDDSEESIALANFPKIRLFTVLSKTSDYQQEDVKGSWVICTPETMKQFSAIGYFFGKELYESLYTPVGMICSAWGGTPAEIWLEADSLNNDVILSNAAKKLKQEPWGPKDPGKAYNAMIYGLAPYKISGALWYQGETNVQNADTYARLLRRLIENWRDIWDDNFPFYFAQIAPYSYGAEHINGAIVRDQQRRVLEMSPNTSMVVLSDIGNLTDIHPKNKIEVGRRFANIALNKVYSKFNTEYSGPLYKSHTTLGNKIIVEFDHAENGLMADGEITYFEIAGEDHSFFPASAKIVGSTIVLESSKVKNPVFIKFAMTNTATPNLFNIEGLPASCFSTEINY